MCTSVGHDSVFLVSTIPRVGLRARDAIPVLNDLDVISRMAVPVVSDPVPAVVGTVKKCLRCVSHTFIAFILWKFLPQINGLSCCAIGRPFPIGAFMKSMRSASL